MNITAPSSYRQRIPGVIDIFFSGGLYITLGASCISNLRLTPKGPLILIGDGGYPFLYEIGVMGVLLATLMRFFYGFPFIVKRQKLALIVLNLFYAPIFIVFMIKSLDMTEFIGGGQLRLQLEIWLLGTALVLYPIKKQTMCRALVIVVFMALVNSFYVIAISQGIFPALYENAYRVPGEIRHSGFLEMPGYLGVLSAIAVSWALWLAPKKSIAIAIFCICGVAVIIADSRTGIVAILTAIGARILSMTKMPWTLNMCLGLLFFLCAALMGVYMPDTYWKESRPISLLAALKIWIDHPFGIPWGAFDQFNPFFGRAVSPHNWPAAALTYGGLPSFLSVVITHIWLFRLWLRIRLTHSVDPFFTALVLIMITIIVSSWFEQVLQTNLAAFVFVSAASLLVHQPTRKPLKCSKSKNSISTPVPQ